MNDLGIYIHVPFCGRKCPYCDFYSVPYTAGAVAGYAAAVPRNIRRYSEPERAVSTLYFGGGTPSLLTTEQLGSIISEVRNCFRFADSAEVTLEPEYPDSRKTLRTAHRRHKQAVDRSTVAA